VSVYLNDAPSLELIFMENGTAHFLILFLKDKIERSKGIGEALKMVQ
jgi:hypothetical protein